MCVWHACVLGVFTCVFLITYTRLGSDCSFLLSPFLASCSAEAIPPQEAKPWVISPGAAVCSSGSSRPSEVVPQLHSMAVPDIAYNTVIKRLNSSPLRTSATEVTQAFLPRGLHSHAPRSRALCPSLTPCFLNPRHKDFFSSYFCDLFFLNQS